jgi:hypothetical protein
VIFLDIDGVLNTTSSRKPSKDAVTVRFTVASLRCDLDVWERGMTVINGEM